jgi:hypothetical protein
VYKSSYFYSSLDCANYIVTLSAGPASKRPTGNRQDNKNESRMWMKSRLNQGYMSFQKGSPIQPQPVISTVECGPKVTISYFDMKDLRFLKVKNC